MVWFLVPETSICGARAPFQGRGCCFKDRLRKKAADSQNLSLWELMGIRIWLFLCLKAKTFSITCGGYLRLNSQDSTVNDWYLMLNREFSLTIECGVWNIKYIVVFILLNIEYWTCITRISMLVFGAPYSILNAPTDHSIMTIGYWILTIAHEYSVFIGQWHWTLKRSVELQLLLM